MAEPPSVDGAATSPSEGVEAVHLARRALEPLRRGAAVRDPAEPFRRETLPPSFDERRGVFVTLLRHPSGALRGCIGFPRPVLALRVAIPQAAWAAATEDPRFPPVAGSELDRLRIEVSLLTRPEPLPALSPPERARSVRVGTDGLIVEGFGSSGLLLPQVAPEQRWDAEEFLAGTCEKAGLPADAWRSPEVRVLRFQAEVFTEASPAGPVVARSNG